MKEHVNWDEYSGRPMFLPAFVYGDGDIQPLRGTCRGRGAMAADEKATSG
jgi:hypothetical protein